MSRIAIFTPVFTFDLDTQQITVDFSGSLTHVQDEVGEPTDRYEDETEAGEKFDAILDVSDDEHLGKLSTTETAMMLRNLAKHIDNFTIQEFP